MDHLDTTRQENYYTSKTARFLVADKYKAMDGDSEKGFCVIELLFDNAGRAIDYRFLEANHIFEKQTGWANPVGKTMRELQPDHEQNWFDIFGQVVKTAKPLHFESEASTPAGVVWYDVFALPFGSTNKHQVAVLFNDITDRKQAQEVLRDINRRKDEFLGMLAHELRNPLSTVRSGLSILKIKDMGNGETAEVVDMMDRQVAHLIRMVDDLLDVSRVTQGKIQLKLERLELAGLLTNVVKAIQSQFDRQHKQLHIMSVYPDLFMEGDATRLAQVLTNLLTNSLRYTGDDGQVWVSLVSENSEAVIRVTDNGIGLLPEQQTDIFKLFMQVDNSLARSQGGLGIGLTLVKQLVEMHGGNVEAKSPGLGQGSEFKVTLPLLNVPAHDYSADEESTVARSSKIHILLIDDMADIAKMTSMFLRLKGYDVDVCTSGREGIEAVETLKPAVVLCDIGMPELDGFQTARLIRQQPWGRQVILIALSGYGQEEDKRRAREAGFDGHLTKPIDIGALKNLITSLMDSGNADFKS